MTVIVGAPRKRIPRKTPKAHYRGRRVILRATTKVNVYFHKVRGTFNFVALSNPIINFGSRVEGWEAADATASGAPISRINLARAGRIIRKASGRLLFSAESRVSFGIFHGARRLAHYSAIFRRRTQHVSDVA